MNFRDFVEQTKDGVEALAAGLRGGRDLTPMLQLDTPDGMAIVAIDALFFATMDSRAQLVQRLVPVVRERQATKVAWIFTAWATNDPEATRPSEADDRYEILVATFIDRERHEVWNARLVRVADHLPPVVAGWQAAPPNQSEGPLLTPIQEALR